MTPERAQRIRDVCAKRQLDLAVILENVHDPHNISAVLRTCDAVGVQTVYVLYTEPNLTKETLQLGRKSSGSARKWVDVHLYRDMDACMQDVRKRCSTILATHIGTGTQSIYELDFTAPTAFLFGNEKDGVSDEAKSHSDGAICIPQSGMVRSLNISVACAVTLYEAYRQRAAAGMYDEGASDEHSAREELLRSFMERHDKKHKGRRTSPRDLG